MVPGSLRVSFCVSSLRVTVASHGVLSLRIGLSLYPTMRRVVSSRRPLSPSSASIGDDDEDADDDDESAADAPGGGAASLFFLYSHVTVTASW